MVEREGIFPVLLLYADVGLVCQPWHGAPHLPVHEPGQVVVDANIVCVLNRGAVDISASASTIQESDYLNYRRKNIINKLTLFREGFKKIHKLGFLAQTPLTLSPFGTWATLTGAIFINLK